MEGRTQVGQAAPPPVANVTQSANARWQAHFSHLDERERRLGSEEEEDEARRQPLSSPPPPADGQQRPRGEERAMLAPLRQGAGEEDAEDTHEVDARALEAQLNVRPQPPPRIEERRYELPWYDDSNSEDETPDFAGIEDEPDLFVGVPARDRYGGWEGSSSYRSISDERGSSSRGEEDKGRRFNPYRRK
ncbi:hypothetical protein QFC24_004050 [Naganishia onofrii]|uniref:Uncharacterized protein n=1 Tax=Naganishia onofrii TaxID=1851511 RepID=A0ACC2XIY8_9TREE|nr:hypothetical protein QFC24_004050 [Naganishia onofrii]